MKPTNECKCRACTNACRYKPGWFMPGEAEVAAEAAGMTLKEYFDKYLAVDYWVTDYPDAIYVLSPAVKGITTGEEWPFNPKGTCVFLKDGLCSIHNTKPYECAFYDHKTTREQTQAERKRIVKAWNKPEHQKQICELLGRKPKMPSFDMMDVFSLVSGT